jgi:IS5 family transposase
MILPQLIPAILLFYHQILLAWAQEIFLADALAHAPNHLLVRLKDLLDFGPLERVCADYRHRSGPGCPPTYPISLLVRAILVGWLYVLSLRKLEERLHCDLVARWFVGCQPGDPIPDHSTLGRFELWLVFNHPDLYFSTFLSQIDRCFPQERRAIQIGDTYAMLANAADEGLVKRIRHVCLRLTMELQESFPGKFESYLQGFDWCALFGVKPEKADKEHLGEGLMDKASRAQRLERTVLAALDFRQRVGSLLDGYDKQQYGVVRGWCSYLDKVLADEVLVERDAAGQPVKASELPNEKKGDFRLISATDPEATLRVHGETQEDVALGYNVQVSVTPNAFIRETKAYTGADPDQSGVATLVSAQKERQEASGEAVQLPPKLIYDMAAGNGKTRTDVKEASDGKTQLVAKSMPYDQRSERFGPYDFTLSADGKVLTCPNGNTSTIAYPSGSGDGRTFRFLACQCWHGEPPKRMKAASSEQLAARCPLWKQCRDSRQGPGAMRQVFISDYRAQVLAAEAYNRTEDFRREMKLRPLVERVIFELTNYNGARDCRRRGQLAADFQAKMCATSHNLKQWVRKLSRVAPARRQAALAG